MAVAAPAQRAPTMTTSFFMIVTRFCWVLLGSTGFYLVRFFLVLRSWFGADRTSNPAEPDEPNLLEPCRTPQNPAEPRSSSDASAQDGARNVLGDGAGVCTDAVDKAGIPPALKIHSQHVQADRR